MRIGFIARFDNSGLGTMSREIAEHLKPVKILLVENGVYQTFPERYNQFDTRRISAEQTIRPDDMMWFFKDIDLILSVETFYNWGLVLFAKRRRVKTALITMFEMTQEVLPDYPDLFICPSELDQLVFQRFKDKSRVEFLPFPVCTDKLQWKKRGLAKNFVHTASHGGVAGRKGTQLLLDAMKFVKSDIDLHIYTWKDIPCQDHRIKILKVNFKDYWQCWQQGDVLVYPQDYNGICLPVVEAWASGLGVISTDIFPFNTYLPKDLLFQPESFYRTRAGASLIEVDAAKISPKDIAAKIDAVAFKDISKFSLAGKEWAEKNNWDALLLKYNELFKSLEN